MKPILFAAVFLAGAASVASIHAAASPGAGNNPPRRGESMRDVLGQYIGAKVEVRENPPKVTVVLQRAGGKFLPVAPARNRNIGEWVIEGVGDDNVKLVRDPARGSRMGTPGDRLLLPLDQLVVALDYWGNGANGGR